MIVDNFLNAIPSVFIWFPLFGVQFVLCARLRSQVRQKTLSAVSFFLSAAAAALPFLLIPLFIFLENLDGAPVRLSLSVCRGVLVGIPALLLFVLAQQPKLTRADRWLAYAGQALNLILLTQSAHAYQHVR